MYVPSIQLLLCHLPCCQKVLFFLSLTIKAVSCQIKTTLHASKTVTQATYLIFVNTTQPNCILLTFVSLNFKKYKVGLRKVRVSIESSDVIWPVRPLVLVCIRSFVMLVIYLRVGKRKPVSLYVGCTFRV